MSSRRWLILPLAALLAALHPAVRALGEPPPRLARIDPPLVPFQTRPGERPSHLPAGSSLENASDPKSAWIKRAAGLGSPAAAEKQLEQLNPELRELARKLLQDREFLDSLRKGLSPADVARLREQLAGGNLPFGGKALEELLKRGRSAKSLDENDQSILQKWAERFGKSATSGGKTEPKDPLPNAPQEANPHPSTLPRAGGPGQPPAWNPAENPPPEWMKERLATWVRDLDRWADSPAGKSWQDTFKNLARRLDRGKSTGADWARRGRGLSRYVGRLSGLTPRGGLPRVTPPHLPTPPRFPSLPSVPSFRGGSAADFGKVLVWAALLGAIFLVLWRGRAMWQAADEHKRAAFRAGPWPVRPGEIATRADLVRAFEHLALVCLGVAARHLNHRELARLLGGQPALDQDRRREAAQTASRLYEQARYTPDDEPLAAEDLRLARRELSYLAGVPAA